MQQPKMRGLRAAPHEKRVGRASHGQCVHPLHAHDGADRAYGIAQYRQENANGCQCGGEGACHNGRGCSATDIGLGPYSDKEERGFDQFGHQEQHDDVDEHPDQTNADGTPV